MTRTYMLDGTGIRTLDDFWHVLMDTFDGPGRHHFGRNLDAFADCLSGGPGAPAAGEYRVEWRAHTVSRAHLGFPETARQLELSLARCHPSKCGCAEEPAWKSPGGL
ncbi:barstar family protein [Streptomycetaceae bacterium NBC_01309]